MIKSFFMALSMFTIIPVPYNVWDDKYVRHLMKFYPIIGLIIGFITYFTYKLTLILNLSIMLKSAIVMIIPFVITGMLHLDGYMDVCDAILSRREKQEKIRILKDPNTGAFAVISLAILFILNFSSLYTIIEKDLNAITFIIIPVISRALMAIMLLKKESMKESFLGSYFKKDTGRLDILILISYLILSFLGLFYFTYYKGILVFIIMILSGLISVNKSSKELGGMSGDSAGYGLIISEFFALFLFAILG